MNEIELDILKVLFENEAVIIKHDGWGSHKIAKNLSVNCDKYEARARLQSLVDNRLVNVKHNRSTVKLEYLGITQRVDDCTYRINAKGIEKYKSEVNKMTVTAEIKTMIDEDLEKFEEIANGAYEEKNDILSRFNI